MHKKPKNEDDKKDKFNNKKMEVYKNRPGSEEERKHIRSKEKIQSIVNRLY